MADMASLGVRAPTVVTRVSEFIPEVRGRRLGDRDTGRCGETRRRGRRETGQRLG